MSLADLIIEHCEQRKPSLEKLIELLESGKMKTGEDRGNGWVDTTTQELATSKKQLEEIKRIEADAKAVKHGQQGQEGTAISDTSSTAPPKP